MLLVHHQRFEEETTSPSALGTQRTLRPAGKLQELTHEMDRYRWTILGLCEMKWENFGKTTTEEGHNVFFSRKEDNTSMALDFLLTRTS